MSKLLLVALMLNASQLFAGQDALTPRISRAVEKPKFVRVDSKPGRLQKVLAQLRENDVSGSAIADERSARAVLVGAAANTPGANGMTTIEAVSGSST